MLIRTLSGQTPGARVEVTGLLTKKRRYKTHYYLRAEDVTGILHVRVDNSDDKEALGERLRALKTGVQVRIRGTLTFNSDSQPVVVTTEAPDPYGRPEASIDALTPDLREHASRVLMASIRAACVRVLEESGFSEFEARVISTDWPNEGLEPLDVVYPGFGSSATLATSPAPQVLDFILTTGTARAFAVSRGFATTYRAEGASTEFVVICARALDLDADFCIELATRLSVGVVADLNDSANQVSVPKIVDAPWPPTFHGGTGSYEIRRYTVHGAPAVGQPSRMVRTVCHSVDDRNNLLLEFAVEEVVPSRTLTTITIYPEHYLPSLSMVTMRQLRDLARLEPWQPIDGRSE